MLYPVRRDELINVVCHYDDENYQHESWMPRCDRAEVLERYAGWHESLLRVFSAGEVWYKWALYDRDPIPEWTRGRVSVLGDSAHSMLPYLGQGACQAIEDGCVLAAALAAKPDDPSRASADTSARAVRGRARSCWPRASAASATISPRHWRRSARPLIAVRRRLGRDPDGRGTGWIPEYDASSPNVLAA